MSNFDVVREALSYPQAWLYPNAPAELKAERMNALAALDAIEGDDASLRGTVKELEVENARLREQVVELEKATAYHYKTEDVIAENARLREALEKIEEATDRANGFGTAAGDETRVRLTHNIARAALKEKE